MSTYLKTRCLCGLNTFKLPLPDNEIIPVTVPLCHCGACRHSTGQSCVAFAELQGPPLSADTEEDQRTPGTLINLTRYPSSPTATRYFCSKCGAHMLFKEVLEDKGIVWHATAGLFEDFDSVVKVTRHIFVADTLDGGIANHMPSISGQPVPSYETFTEAGNALSPNWRDAKSHPQPVKDVLRFHCHCKSVTFYIKRTTKIRRPEAEFWHVPGANPTDPIRFTASHCFCDSCRLAGGSVFQTWIFVPPLGTIFADPECRNPVNLQHPEKRPSGMVQFKSSEDVCREFCATCGATTFYWNPGPDEDKVDIAHGLLDQEQGGGVLAETWLAWGRMGQTQEAQASRVIINALRDGFQLHKIVLG